MATTVYQRPLTRTPQTPWIGRTALPQTGPDIMVQPYRTGYETPQPRRPSHDHRSASPMPTPTASRRHSQRASQPSTSAQHPPWLRRAIESGYRLDPTADRRFANPPLLSSDNNRSWTLGAQNAGYTIDTERMIIIPPRPEHEHRPSDASQDDGYSTTPEAGSTPSSRQRRGSDAMHRPTTPAAAAPPPRRGILKRMFSTNDRAASTPPAENRPRSGSQNRGRPILHIPESQKMDYALHWQLLPYNAQSGKPRMYYDIRFPAEYASHVHDGQGHFPISRRELEKPATKKGLSYMTFTAWDLPIFDIEVHRHEGVRVCDVLERVYEHYQLVLTRTEKALHRDRVERAQPYYEERVRQELQRDPLYVDSGMRRIDLMEGKVVFIGCQWRHPCEEYPDGSWTLLFLPPPRAAPAAAPATAPVQTSRSRRPSIDTGYQYAGSYSHAPHYYATNSTSYTAQQRPRGGSVSSSINGYYQ